MSSCLSVHLSAEPWALVGLRVVLQGGWAVIYLCGTGIPNGGARVLQILHCHFSTLWVHWIWPHLEKMLMHFLMGLLLEEWCTVLTKTVWNALPYFSWEQGSDIPILASVCKHCVGTAAWKEKNAIKVRRGEEPLLPNSNKKYKLILNAGHIPLKSSHLWLVFLANAGHSGALWLIVTIIHIWKFLFCWQYWKTNCSWTASDTIPIKWPIIKIIWQIKFSYINDGGKLSCHCKKKVTIVRAWLNKNWKCQ